VVRGKGKENEDGNNKKSQIQYEHQTSINLQKVLGVKIKHQYVGVGVPTSGITEKFLSIHKLRSFEAVLSPSFR